MADGEHPTGGELGMAISNGVVQVMAQTTGRGPNRARTTLREDVIIVAVRDTLTKGERVLVDAGVSGPVLRIREAWQNLMRPALTTLVEELTGRRVIGLMTGQHIDPDVASMVFVLEAAAERPS